MVGLFLKRMGILVSLSYVLSFLVTTAKCKNHSSPHIAHSNVAQGFVDCARIVFFIVLLFNIPAKPPRKGRLRSRHLAS